MYGGGVHARLRDGADLSQAVERQVHWRRIADSAARRSAREVAARRAHDRLGLLMAEMDSNVRADAGAAAG